MKTYDDHDGVSILVDRKAMLARYADAPAGQLDYDINTTLCGLMNAHEAACFGSRDGGEFGVSLEVLESGAASPAPNDELLACGSIVTTGELVLAGWHEFTTVADRKHGVFEEEGNAIFALPPGRYRVFVARDFETDEIHLTLAPSDDSDVTEFSTIPGADGYF